MKTILALFLAVPSWCMADPVLTAHGPHHDIRQRVSERTTSYARMYYVTNSYIELGTGKNHLRGGQWVPSVAEITILPSGFGVATQAQHKVIFAPNINTLGAIDCLTPENHRLRSHVLGLAYTDKRTGQGVMIAEIRDSTGIHISNNQVLYPDAFDSEGGFRADIRYTLTLAGLEQDIILVESPPDPTIYGIPPENCRLEVYSEFVEHPVPGKETVVLNREEDLARRQAMVEPDLLEETLVFGAMRMGQGVAFRFGPATEDTAVPIGKTWEQREGRQLLIERADYTSVQGELDRLPLAAQLQNPKRTVPLKPPAGAAWASFLPTRPPKTHAEVRKLRSRDMAQVHLPRQGLVLDWQLVINQTNFIFRGDSTYYASSDVNLSETTTWEAGTVVKFSPTNNPRLHIKGPIDCQTSSARPAWFTARDDDTIGDQISGSTGSPETNYYGSTRCIDLNSAGTAYSLHDLRFRYLRRNLAITAASSVELAHSQMSYGEIALYKTASGAIPIALRNVLMDNMGIAFSGGTNHSAENCTFHRINTFESTASTTAYATNCLLAAVTNNLNLSGISNVTVLNDAGVFQTSGYGARYLAANSPYRNAGTTNIDPSLRAALRQMTTYPPLLISNSITTDTSLTPQAQRDTDAPDIGAHYLPIDWIVGGLSVTGATLRVSGGATVAIDAASTNWGIRLESGGQLLSEGDPVNLNRFVRTHSVQEIPAGAGASVAPLFADTHPAPASPVSVNLRFTDIPQVQKHLAFSQENALGTFGTIILRDSQFRGGKTYLSQSVSNQYMAVTNLLVEDSGWTLYPYTPTTFHMRNATFKSGKLDLYIVAGSTWSVKDSVFDYTTVTNTGAGTLAHDYNGYLTNGLRFTPNGANDVVLATNTVNFQTGPLGAYYLPTNSAFIDKGSVRQRHQRGFRWLVALHHPHEPNQRGGHNARPWLSSCRPGRKQSAVGHRW